MVFRFPGHTGGGPELDSDLTGGVYSHDVTNFWIVGD